MIANSVYQAVNFYFHLLLQNHWANFNQTLYWVKEVSSNRKGLLNSKNSLNNLKAPLSWNTGPISIENLSGRELKTTSFPRRYSSKNIFTTSSPEPLNQFQPNLAKSSRRWDTKSLYKCTYNHIFVWNPATGSIWFGIKDRWRRPYILYFAYLYQMTPYDWNVHERDVMW